MLVIANDYDFNYQNSVRNPKYDLFSHGSSRLTSRVRHAGPNDVNREAELDRPSRVAAAIC